MLANYPQHEDVEISQCMQPDQQADPESTLGVPISSLSPEETNRPLSLPNRISSSLQQRARCYLERKRLRQAGGPQRLHQVGDIGDQCIGKAQRERCGRQIGDGAHSRLCLVGDDAEHRR